MITTAKAALGGAVRPSVGSLQPRSSTNFSCAGPSSTGVRPAPKCMRGYRGTSSSKTRTALRLARSRSMLRRLLFGPGSRRWVRPRAAAPTPTTGSRICSASTCTVQTECCPTTSIRPDRVERHERRHAPDRVAGDRLRELAGAEVAVARVIDGRERERCEQRDRPNRDLAAPLDSGGRRTRRRRKDREHRQQQPVGDSVEDAAPSQRTDELDAVGLDVAASVRTTITASRPPQRVPSPTASSQRRRTAATRS